MGCDRDVITGLEEWTVDQTKCCTIMLYAMSHTTLARYTGGTGTLTDMAVDTAPSQSAGWFQRCCDPRRKPEGHRYSCVVRLPSPPSVYTYRATNLSMA